MLDHGAKKEEIGKYELDCLANKFVEEIEDGMFTPADIQGFLIKQKNKPGQAVEEVGRWV